ncbi:hypothetical protein [Kribbella solani]|uniref:hypothetical protein n=1 Tax=Kribbella solani TaxID=236067 RepID=UPI0029BA561B|nr:hypothetical protein [Kribbella solani]MDX2972012.1 hypothetical protein [Kribbella solani]
MAIRFGRGKNKPVYTGINTQEQQQSIDKIRSLRRNSRGHRPDADALDSRDIEVGSRIERIALITRELSGLPGGGNGWWHAERSRRDDLQIWFDRNSRPVGPEGTLNVGGRAWEVIGEMTGQSRAGFGQPAFGSAVEEQRDVLFALVAEEADRAAIGAPDAPPHRPPYEASGPGYPRQRLNSLAVSEIWLQRKFGEVVDAMRTDGIVSDQTARRLLAQAPKDVAVVASYGRALADGTLDPKSYQERTARPANLQLSRSATAVQGLLDDLAKQAGANPRLFIREVHLASPPQKSWQIAGRLLANSPLQAQSPEKYLETKEQLSVVVEAQLGTLTATAPRDPEAAREQARAGILEALGKLEAAAATPEAPAVQEKFIDPRVGVAQPGGASAPPPGSAGGARPDHLKSHNHGQQLGS